MTYATTTITAGTVNTSSAVMTWLDGLLTTEGYTLHDTWTSSTKTGKVYKSPAASNDLGIDWYLTMYRASDSANQVYFGVCLDWDLVNHKALKFAPSPYYADTCNIHATERTVDDSTGVLLDHNKMSHVYTYHPSAPASNIVFVANVTVDRLIVGTTSGPNAGNYPVYVGQYVPVLPTALDPGPPLCVHTFFASYYHGAGYSGSAVTEPKPTTGPVRYAFNLVPFTPSNQNSRQYAWVARSSANPDPIMTGDGYRTPVLGWSAAPISFIGYYSQYAPALRGYFLDVVTAKDGAAAGDTLTVTQEDGVTTKTYILIQIGTQNLCHVWMPNT